MPEENVVRCYGPDRPRRERAFDLMLSSSISRGGVALGLCVLLALASISTVLAPITRRVPHSIHPVHAHLLPQPPGVPTSTTPGFSFIGHPTPDLGGSGTEIRATDEFALEQGKRALWTPPNEIVLGTSTPGVGSTRLVDLLLTHARLRGEWWSPLDGRAPPAT